MDFDALDAAAFSKNYLTPLPKGFRSRHKDRMALFNEERRKMFGGKLNESKQYECMVDMLNHASTAVYAEIHNTHPTSPRLQFIDTHAAHLIRHQKNYKDKPDICAVESSHVPSSEKTDFGYYHRVPWHKVHSVGEVKPSANESKKERQIMTYVDLTIWPAPTDLDASPSAYLRAVIRSLGAIHQADMYPRQLTRKVRKANYSSVSFIPFTFRLRRVLSLTRPPPTPLDGTLT
ncbi:hypothetical protein IW261DRAFT_372458 [Armillaria novae-zelandiae]|uniref:Uncharacterized protein n=1 Tax=Armillaria novae-zelandiae TaxID=153914 RepID=A0AA39UGT6_9AGAR|nr:hypothetical protein IW261DRAFT_372458 [Armillaria novae-zelandiae]